ncbi:MAG TPA: orotidine 5'-phosphate decarboxylase, partial [Methanomassiliicoccales archaeon]|nr:orotidine 5'-phosphate decarboxylase [Methanomassiliicoccales archaeon]
MKPVLQVALDLMHLKRALEIARESLEGGADWIEAGTPLIKSEGAECLRALKREFPGRTLVADMKTMDVGAFEVEIAAKAGADIVTVLGLSDDGTISESVLTARQYGAAVMLDLINVPDKVARARRAEELGVRERPWIGDEERVRLRRERGAARLLPSVDRLHVGLAIEQL